MEAKIPVHPRSSTGDQENEACRGLVTAFNGAKVHPRDPAGAR